MRLCRVKLTVKHLGTTNFFCFLVVLWCYKIYVNVYTINLFCNLFWTRSMFSFGSLGLIIWTLSRQRPVSAVSLKYCHFGFDLWTNEVGYQDECIYLCYLSVNFSEIQSAFSILLWTHGCLCSHWKVFLLLPFFPLIFWFLFYD